MAFAGLPPAANFVRSTHWLSRRPGSAEQFRDYIDAVERFGVSHFDRVFLDGRARSACAEHILPWLTNTSLVFWHDFFPVRQHPCASLQDVVQRQGGTAWTCWWSA